MPTVKTGASIDVSALGIKDIGAESADSTASAAIGGTFGSQVARNNKHNSSRWRTAGRRRLR